MDVRCPKCSTVYELDPDQIKTTLVTLKCSQCQHVFRFEARTGEIQENLRRWMIRDVTSGDVLYVNNFETVHQWMMERKISKSDEISRTGKKWTKLEDIGEFAPVFQVVESISSIAGLASSPKPEPSPVESQLPPSPSSRDDGRERVQTTLLYGNPTEEVTKRARPTGPQPVPQPIPQPVPAPIETPVANPLQEDWRFGAPNLDSHSEVEDLPSKSKAPWFVLLFGLVLAGGAAYIYQFEPALMKSLASGHTGTTVVSLSEDLGSPDVGTEPVADDSPNAQARVSTALAAASKQQVLAESELWDRVIAASRPSFDQALGVATEDAEQWAEGGGIPNLLSEAARSLERGRAKRALAKYQDVLKLDPRNAEAVTGVGWAYLAMSRYADASQQFKAAIKVDRKYGDAYIGLGSSERQRGNLKEAYDAYDLYLGRLPKGPKASIARYQLEQLKQQLGI